MSWFNFFKSAAAGIPTPATDQVNIFADSATGEPSYKDDTGTVTSLKGASGPTGQGVPVGGTASQVLSKIDSTDFNTEWSTPVADVVQSVNGETGVVVLDAADVGAIPDTAATAFGLTLIDDADATAARTTLGLGTAATTAAADYATAAQGTLAGTAVQPAGLAIYAPLASPALTGTPTVPTATPATNTTQAASTAYVDAAVAAVPGGSGDVVGPATATADAVALFDGTTGELLKDGETIASIRSIPQNSRSAAYTLVSADAGLHIYHPSADTTARIWTIPANASVAFPIGSALTFVNDNAAGVITIAITTDTMRLAGAGTTGSRTLAANGIATAIKMTATTWQINGTGLT